MSQRHRATETPPPPKREVKAHAHGERHRIHVELNQVAHLVSSGLDPADVHEPGRAWRPSHRRDRELAARKDERARRPVRHWKTKMWKRRTSIRRQRALALRRIIEA